MRRLLLRVAPDSAIRKRLLQLGNLSLGEITIAEECDIFYDGAVDPTLLALYFVKHSNFDLLKPIGQGAYGEVWLARDVNHLHADRYRAIKVVRQGGAEHMRSYQREYKGVERYEPRAA